MLAVRRFPTGLRSVYLSPKFLEFSLQEFDRCVGRAMIALENWRLTCAATLLNRPIVERESS